MGHVALCCVSSNHSACPQPSSSCFYARAPLAYLSVGWFRRACADRVLVPNILCSGSGWSPAVACMRDQSFIARALTHLHERDIFSELASLCKSACECFVSVCVPYAHTWRTRIRAQIHDTNRHTHTERFLRASCPDSAATTTGLKCRSA